MGMMLLTELKKPPKDQQTPTLMNLNNGGSTTPYHSESLMQMKCWFSMDALNLFGSTSDV